MRHRAYCTHHARQLPGVPVYHCHVIHRCPNSSCLTMLGWNHGPEGGDWHQQLRHVEFAERAFLALNGAVGAPRP